MIEIILFLAIGVIAGIFTGLAPGIHINLIASFIVALIPKFDFITPVSALVFIVSMSITHLFIDFIPSIYLGAPDEETFLSILPGHQMLQDGHGHEAIVYTALGTLSGVVVSILLTPFFLILLPLIFDKVSSIIPYLLIFVSLFLVFRENSVLPSFIVFILGGFLGVATFNLPLSNPLTALLTGLFGISSLIISINQKTKIPKQKTPFLKDIYFDKPSIVKSFFNISLIAPFLSTLPGIGSSQATLISNEIRQNDTKSFLFMQGTASAIFMVFSFVTLYLLDKTRSGSASAIKSLISDINLEVLILTLLICFIVGLISFYLCLGISKSFCSFIQKINYSLLSICVSIFLILLVLLLSGWIGLIVLTAGTSLGIYASLSNVKKSNLMSALIVPAIIYYLTI